MTKAEYEEERMFYISMYAQGLQPFCSDISELAVEAIRRLDEEYKDQKRRKRH